MTNEPDRIADEQLLNFMQWRTEGHTSVQIAKANSLTNGWVRVVTNRVRLADEAHEGCKLGGYW